MEPSAAANSAEKLESMVRDTLPESFEGAAHLTDIERLVKDVHRLGLITDDASASLANLIEEKFKDHHWLRVPYKAV